MLGTRVSWGVNVGVVDRDAALRVGQVSAAEKGDLAEVHQRVVDGRHRQRWNRDGPQLVDVQEIACGEVVLDDEVRRVVLHPSAEQRLPLLHDRPLHLGGEAEQVDGVRLAPVLPPIEAGYAPVLLCLHVCPGLRFGGEPRNLSPG